MRFKPRDLSSRILLPFCYTALAAAASFLLRAYLTRTLSIAFDFSVILSAWSGGFVGGLVASVTSVFAIDYLFLPPVYHLGPLGYSDAMVALLFLATASVVSRFVAKARQNEGERVARLSAESMNEAKDYFLSQVAHELRNPLATISMALEVWKSDPNNSETAQLAIDTISRSLKLEIMFVNDLVDWARIKSGKLELHIRPIRLSDVIEAAWSVVQNQAESKDIHRQVSIAPEADQIETDEERLIQVIWNLFTNSVKFTPNGGHITVTATSLDGYVNVAIRDTGRGIAREALPHLFDSFWQTYGQDSKIHGGLGLGLSIASQIIKRLGGTIRAESDGPDKGATFIIQLKKAVRQGMS